MTTVIPTTNQQEEAITTTTELKPYIQFTPDTEVNKRLKVAQMAKQFIKFTGVANAQVGTVTYFDRGHEHSRSEVVQVTYNHGCLSMVQDAGFPLFVTRAWFTKDELFGAEFTFFAFEPRMDYVMFNRNGTLRLLGHVTDGVNEREMRNLVTNQLRDTGDQYVNAFKAVAERARVAAKEAEHQAKIQAAYADREASGGHWRAQWCLEKAQGGLAAADEDGWKKHREALNQAYKTLVDCYNVELWAIVEANLGKLRCETNITNGDDPYGFVTIAEVAYHILYKWVNNGYWDSKEVRHVVASEFVRNHLS